MTTLSPDKTCLAAWHPAIHLQPESVARKNTGAMERLPKTAVPSCASDNRAVALTSHVMKVLGTSGTDAAKATDEN